MRRLMLALMIVLLPLRSGIGDAMATEMAAVQFQANQNVVTEIAEHGHDAVISGHFHEAIAVSGAATPHTLTDMQQGHDCGTGATQSAKAHHVNGGDCSSCSSCQACHTITLSHTSAKSLGTINAVSLPEAIDLHYASADAALSQKPPIS